MWTSLTLIQWTSDWFKKQGIPNPRLDSELLLAHILGVKRIDLYTQHEGIIGEKQRARYKMLVQRRAKREPLQYIIGETEFFGLTIQVTPDVLIPRPETEVLVELAIKCVGAALRGRPDEEHPQREIQILDIGTGSGCIAIALAKNLPSARVVATDISKEALTVAGKNGTLQKLSSRIKLVLTDLAPWKSFEAAGQKFDLILSNPPYIATGEFPTLQPEVRDFEPRIALEGGKDGLDFYRRIAEDAPRFLAPGGGLFLEVGETQAAIVSELLEKRGLACQIKMDLTGINRIVIGRKKTNG